MISMPSGSQYDQGNSMQNMTHLRALVAAVIVVGATVVQAAPPAAKPELPKLCDIINNTICDVIPGR